MSTNTVPRHATVVPHHCTALLLRPHHRVLPLVAVQHLCKERPPAEVGCHNRRAHPAEAVPHLYTVLRQAEGPLQHKAVWQRRAVEASDLHRGLQWEAAVRHLYREQRLAAEVPHRNKVLLLAGVAVQRQEVVWPPSGMDTAVSHPSTLCRTQFPIQTNGSSARRYRGDRRRSLRGSSKARRRDLHRNSDRDGDGRLHWR